DDRKAAAAAMPPMQTMKPHEDVVTTDAQPAQGSADANAADPTEPIQPIEVAAPVAPSDAGNAPELPQRSQPATPAQTPPAAAAPSGATASRPAPPVAPAKPVTPPTKAADQPAKRSGQVAVFVSRKEQKIFVRQGFVPLFDMPVVIDQPDQPLGTHVFTA